MDIVVTSSYDSLKVRIGGVLHVHLKRSDLIGIQAGRNGGKYSIEYYLKGDVHILTEYDNTEKWQTILRQLDEMLD